MRALFSIFLATLFLPATALAQLSDAGGSIRIKADRSEVREKERQVLLIDNVDIVQADARLRADRIVISYAEADDAAQTGSASRFGAIETMTATGDVFYITPELKARGDKGVYTAASDTIILTGKVVLLREEDVAEGQRLVVNLTEGRTVLDAGNDQINLVIAIPEDEETAPGSNE